jgi:hypothetical protein
MGPFAILRFVTKPGLPHGYHLDLLCGEILADFLR